MKRALLVMLLVMSSMAHADDKWNVFCKNFSVLAGDFIDDKNYGIPYSDVKSSIILTIPPGATQELVLEISKIVYEEAPLGATRKEVEQTTERACLENPPNKRVEKKKKYLM